MGPTLLLPKKHSISQVLSGLRRNEDNLPFSAAIGRQRITVSLKTPATLRPPKWLSGNKERNAKNMDVITREQTRNPDASILVLGWFAFPSKQRIPRCGGVLMKTVEIKSSIGLDRLATWNEVRCAMSCLSQASSELARSWDDSHEADSDFRGRACNLPEDDMWLAIISDMPDSRSN